MSTKVATSASSDAKSILSGMWTIGLKETPVPVDPVRLAHSFGIDVYDDDLSNNVRAAIVKNDQVGPVILIRRRDRRPVKRMRVAIMIGHFVRHTNNLDTSDYNYIELEDTVKIAPNSEPWVYAVDFARELLMPSDALRRLQKRGVTVAEMVHTFDVEASEVVARVRALG
jgi:Zn-dependent peptidase ImmA (M78 family)